MNLKRSGNVDDINLKGVLETRTITTTCEVDPFVGVLKSGDNFIKNL